MSTNEEVIKSIVDDYESIEKLWCPYALVYNALKVGSIDGTDIIPHDRAIARAQEADYKSNNKVKGKPDCTIFVGRLAKITDFVTLKKVFGNYGIIKRCRLVEDIVTGTSKGYAFIEYETESSAAAAYKHCHLMNLDGKQIIVDFECERLLPGWIPRRLGGGFCGRKESGQLRFGCRCKPFAKPINLMTKEDLLENSAKGGRRKDECYNNQEIVDERHNVLNKRKQDTDLQNDRSPLSRSSRKERCSSIERRRGLTSHERQDRRRSEHGPLSRHDRSCENSHYELKKAKRGSSTDRKRSRERKQLSHDERRSSHKKKSKKEYDHSVRKSKKSHHKKKKKRHLSPKNSCDSSEESSGS